MSSPAPAPPAALAATEAVLEQLESARAVKRLQRILGYYLDRGAWDEAAELFGAGASLEVALDGVYVGRERIRSYLYALGGGRRGIASGELHECLQLQPLVHVGAEPGQARARWRMLVLAGRLGRGAWWGEGPCESEYSRDAPGWRIARLHAYQTFVVPYEGGWVHNADATGGRLVSPTLPADRPPSESYDTWPGVYSPALHYAPEPCTLDEGAPAEPALQGLRARVARLADREAIEALISAYGYCLDKQLWDALAALFAEDATMEISQRGVYAGRASIRRALELFGSEGIKPGHLHNHMQMQPVIHIAADGRRGWARSRAFSQLGVYERAGLWMGGVYENEFVKQDGVWRFRTDHVYTTFFADHARGWSEGARAAAQVSEKIPPDRPPSERYEAFPGAHVPPFHYPHPLREAAPAPAGAPLAGALAGLGARVQRLEDESAIENLQRTCGYYLDKGLWSEAADLFSREGRLEIGGEVFCGRARLTDHLRSLGPEGPTPGRLSDHLLVQPVVTIDPDANSARGRWKYFAQLGQHGGAAQWALGTYENEYVKQHGVWCIGALNAWPRMLTPYAQGWGRSQQYPEPNIPAEHYPHPLRGR